MNLNGDNLEQRCINTIRFLSADAVQKANSGHPGAPMGAATMAFILWTRFLRHNPKNPLWPNRDRFVLSAGHASMLLYSLLHLTGYDLTLDDIRNFRQWGSRTPGHPEFGVTPGVEATTGPLGQGLGNAVGMALAEAHLAAMFNRPGHTIIDHSTFVLASDGDLMEGVSSEASSLAGHLKLGKLIVLYDRNFVTLSASTWLAFTEDTYKRYEAYGWHVQKVEDGNDLEAIEKALYEAKAETGRPSLVMVHTVIGYGSPHKSGTYQVHGSPLGVEELKASKKNLNWPLEPDFLIPDDVRDYFLQAVKRGEEVETDWQKLFSGYEKMYPDLATEFNRVIRGELPAGWDENMPVFPPDDKGQATRKASEAVIQSLARKIPELIGGSGDLNPSTFTWLKELGDFQSRETSPVDKQGSLGGEWDYGGRNIQFGVREHAMGAILNGIALHGGLRPYGSTFLIFSDYMRPPMRLAALSKLPVIYIFTHDSIGLGEDGPTHQPVEQMMGLRAIPDVTLIRPADSNETLEAWKVALRNKNGPVALVFTRQNVPVLDRNKYFPANGLQRGGYVLWQSGENPPRIILIGTGSEVYLALKAGEKLAAEGIRVRVVSLPSWKIFDEQPESYREDVLPENVRMRVAVEAGAKLGWEHYIGLDGVIVGMERFGASAPGETLFEKFGITVDRVVEESRKLLEISGDLSSSYK
jgi:transketolase